MLYIELQLNGYTKWTTYNYSQLYSIIVVIKPKKSTEIGTRVDTHFIAIPRYTYSHIMCIVLMSFPNTGKDKQYMFR